MSTKQIVYENVFVRVVFTENNLVFTEGRFIFTDKNDGESVALDTHEMMVVIENIERMEV